MCSHRGRYERKQLLKYTNRNAHSCSLYSVELAILISLICIRCVHFCLLYSPVFNLLTLTCRYHIWSVRQVIRNAQCCLFFSLICICSTNVNVPLHTCNIYHIIQSIFQFFVSLRRYKNANQC